MNVAQSRLRPIIAVMGVAVIAITSLLVATPARADNHEFQYLSVTKTATPNQLVPGESFTYRIDVLCSEQACLDAELFDQFPAELDGWAITDVAFAPGETTIPRDVTWIVDGTPQSAPPAAMTADTALQVNFTGDVNTPPGTGLAPGQQFTAYVTLSVPTDLGPGRYDITNVAETTATNSLPDEAPAPIVVEVAEAIDVNLEKSWSPSPQTFSPGAFSQITLEAENTSNITVDTLTIQEPRSAPDGASHLDATNPFTIVNFDGVSTVALPDGADTVQIDAYVRVSGVWTWVTGTPSTTFSLPSSVAPAGVGGLRYTFAGDNIEVGADAVVTVDVSQRDTDRNTGVELSAHTHTVNNVALSTVTASGHDPVSDPANATYTVNPVAVEAGVVKSFSPDRLAAGDTTTGRIVASNNSDIGVNQLKVVDLDFFTADISFDGFTAPPTWPATAGSASVTWYPLDGGTLAPVPFVEGQIPVAPVPISGFEIVFTASGGGIAPGSSTTIDFAVDTSEDAIPADDNEITERNTATASVVAPNGLNHQISDSADLTLLEPSIDVTLDKTVWPSSPVEPEDRVVTQLAANLTTTSDYITADTIVIEDAWTGDGEFWDAFNLNSVAPTQVPVDTSLEIEVRDASGTWHSLTVFPAQDAAFLADLSRQQVVDALPGGVGIDDVTGVRFTFENVSSTGFPADTTVEAFVVTDARGELRSGGSTTPGPDQPVSYQNFATADGAGETGSGTPLTDDDDDIGEAEIVTYEGIGPVGIDKTWNLPTVPAQSSAERLTTLSWSVNEGYGTVTITDPTNPASPADSVFEAFDLVAIESISASDTPFANGWYLRYDTITEIALYDDGWQIVPEPGGGWIVDGAFVGYSLTEAQRESMTGVRITLEENTEAREAAREIGDAFDPFAPEPGTGVAASSGDRAFTLTWEVRDQTRPAGDWVTSSESYNTATPGLVNNTAILEAEPLGGGTSETDTTADTILITDPAPAVNVTKTSSPSTPLYVPAAGTDASAYPTATFAVEAWNSSVARASYVRVMDPPACADGVAITECQGEATAAGAVADPFDLSTDWLTTPGLGNPFERFDLTGLYIRARIASQIDLTQSVVWLLHYDEDTGDYSTSESTADVVNAMSEADLADVVGLSVTFQGADPDDTGGTITQDNRVEIDYDVRLRTHLRSSGEPQTVAANATVVVNNRAFAQSYDPILSDGVATGDLDHASVTLTGGDLNVGATKSVNPTALTEPTRNDPVTVTLGANQGTAPRSSLATAEVRLTDDADTSPDFWDQFAFTGLGDLSAPAGADQVSVSVYGPFGLGGALAWVDGVATAVGDAEVPVGTDAYQDIVGVEFAFSRADGEFFSDQFPAPDWSASAQFTVELRDTYRGSEEPIELSGEVDNTVSVVSDRLNGEISEVRNSTAEVVKGSGSFELEVHKLANEGFRNVSAGTSVPWDLTLENAGTGFLTLTEVRDSLPEHLAYLGEAPAYSPEFDGLLGLPQLELDGDDLVFTWAEGANTMAPGETFSIRIWLELQPGLVAGEQAVNELTVSTAETLGRCGNISPGGDTTGAWDDDPATCGTTDYVSPQAGSNLFSVKGVRGDLPGADDPNQPSWTCLQNLEATGGSYFRAPCAANSVIGGTDDWVMRTQNAGTIGFSEIVVFDSLPDPDDTFLISGLPRGSSYRPQLVEAPQITAPADTVVTMEVTTSSGACVGTWATVETAEPCEQNGEVWVEADSSTDWTAVTGLRIWLSFSDTQAGVLAPGEFVDVTFSTLNVPASDTDPDGAITDVPATDTYAWNQFGVKYLEAGQTAYRKLAPSRVGVHLPFGAIEVSKAVTGPAAAYAADEFLIDVLCTVEGVELNLGDLAEVALSEDNSFIQRIDGIPLGSSCILDEQGEVGAFGETSRDGTPAQLHVTEVVGLDDLEVPAAQTAEITNDYQFGSLSVTKTVASDVQSGAFGPFDFELFCVAGSGLPVTFAGDEEVLTFSLVDGETFAVPANTIPVGSLCFIAEVGAADADLITVVGTDVVDLEDGFALVDVGVLPAEVTFTNSFDSTVFSVTKEVDGDGAELVGDTAFGFELVCSYGVTVLVDETFQLTAGMERTFGPVPSGTECIVIETDAGEAVDTRVTVETTDAVDEIAAAEADFVVEDTGEQVAVTFVNTFDAPVADDDALSDTGANGVIAAALSAMALLLVGGVLVLMRRRQMI